ncbi:MAG: transcriptional regulator, GntR family [Oscillospiraceae bacterium]|nr:transcriptional regulator, GntR family [Oscillospiraceae bacterium]
MFVNFEDERPIFIQISENIEDAILSGAFLEESQIPSTTEISVNYKINPATALKGVNILVENGIIYKKRGIGMFVSTGAVEKITDKRKKQFYENYIIRLTSEAKKLQLSQQEIISMIESGFSNEQN